MYISLSWPLPLLKQIQIVKPMNIDSDLVHGLQHIRRLEFNPSSSSRRSLRADQSLRYPAVCIKSDEASHSPKHKFSANPILFETRILIPKPHQNRIPKQAPNRESTSQHHISRPDSSDPILRLREKSQARNGEWRRQGRGLDFGCDLSRVFFSNFV